MTPEQNAAWAAYCAELSGLNRNEPLDLPKYNAQRAAEMYRAEARRLEPKPQQQLHLAA